MNSSYFTFNDYLIEFEKMPSYLYLSNNQDFNVSIKKKQFLKFNKVIIEQLLDNIMLPKKYKYFLDSDIIILSSNQNKILSFNIRCIIAYGNTVFAYPFLFFFNYTVDEHKKIKIDNNLIFVGIKSQRLELPEYSILMEKIKTIFQHLNVPVYFLIDYPNSWNKIIWWNTPSISDEIFTPENYIKINTSYEHYDILYDFIRSKHMVRNIYQLFPITTFYLKNARSNINPSNI